ncbi:MAG: DUF309 domain-containing protein [Prochlorococcus sp.]|nr:DUF309 domain-containing protein [Prochlorococcaceae cyanobacterium ETNP18_MAG_14]MDP6309651.1 DUF309 domain-containing protein [Prochlorococcaceae cyanobacterium ETNP14_MAG_4]HJL68329.1 DUF309 domain-containing protein [Prochlorococcaceae cyanobacterium Gl_MAG_24]HJM80159.1 DUF309 domain-containing protein [Prochlorococcaceae cyanobacterium Fu_MAG_72]
MELQPSELISDPRFQHAIELFNAADWYAAHDAFEELWHETSGPEHQFMQGVLQVAVAQFHLERGNLRGATILYGEALGRFKALGTTRLGIDLGKFSASVQVRLQRLQQGQDPDVCTVPGLLYCSVVTE